MRSRWNSDFRYLARVAVTAAAIVCLAPEPSRGSPGITREAVAGTWAARVGPLFPMGLEGPHSCTASIVQSKHLNLIATAAHCLDGVVIAEVLFVPGYQDGRTPNGVWRLSGAYRDPSWEEARNPVADIAFATVEPVDDQEIESVLGAFPISDGHRSDHLHVTILGYPRTQDSPLDCKSTARKYGRQQLRVHCPRLTGARVGVRGSRRPGS